MNAKPTNRKRWCFPIQCRAILLDRRIEIATSFPRPLLFTSQLTTSLSRALGLEEEAPSERGCRNTRNDKWYGIFRRPVTDGKRGVPRQLPQISKHFVLHFISYRKFPDFFEQIVMLHTNYFCREFPWCLLFRGRGGGGGGWGEGRRFRYSQGKVKMLLICRAVTVSSPGVPLSQKWCA